MINRYDMFLWFTLHFKNIDIHRYWQIPTTIHGDVNHSSEARPLIRIPQDSVPAMTCDQGIWVSLQNGLQPSKSSFFSMGEMMINHQRQDLFPQMRETNVVKKTPNICWTITTKTGGFSQGKGSNSDRKSSRHLGDFALKGSMTDLGRHCSHDLGQVLCRCRWNFLDKCGI